MKIRLVAALLALAAAPAISQTDPLSAAAKEAGAVVTPSGLVFRSLTEGSGATPTAGDTVRVHYRGTFPDGREFDSSYSRRQVATFPLGGVIPCWTEGLQRIKVGGKARLTCPSHLAYGPRGAGRTIPPNAVLHFEVDLIEIVPR